MGLIIGKIYRLRFPGIAARVLPNPPKTTVTMHDGMPGYLVESLFCKSRWWVNEKGEPNNYRSPHMIVPLPPSPEKEGAGPVVSRPDGGGV